MTRPTNLRAVGRPLRAHAARVRASAVWLGILFLFFASLCPRAFAADLIALVLSERGGAYEEAASALRLELRTAELVELNAGDAEAIARVRARVIVAIGTHACRASAESASTTPVVCTLLPRSAFDRIARSAGFKARQATAIVLDQPFSRQIALVRAVLPASRQLGVLLGPDSASVASAIGAAASERRLHVTTATVENSDALYPALQRILNDADVLLALPDARIFNSSTSQNILRASFQSRTPVIAFSPAYVRAGALAAVYSTPAQLGRETGRLVSGFLSGRSLPSPQAPREFEVSVNSHVARALGLVIDDENALEARLRKLESSR